MKSVKAVGMDTMIPMIRRSVQTVTKRAGSKRRGPNYVETVVERDTWMKRTNIKSVLRVKQIVSVISNAKTEV
jgi:hypothetical protein